MPAMIRRFAVPTKNPTHHLAKTVEPAEPEHDPDTLKTEPASSKNLNPSNILNLQRTLGNQAVMRLLQERQNQTSSRPADAQKPGPGLDTSKSAVARVASTVIQRTLRDEWSVKALTDLQSNTAKAKNVTMKAFSKLKGGKTETETDSTLTQLIDAYKVYMVDDAESDLPNLGKLKTLCNKWFANSERNTTKWLKLTKFEKAVVQEIETKLTPFSTKIGLPMSYLKELLIKEDVPNPLDLLLKADNFLQKEDLVKADAALVQLQEVLGEPYKLVKGALIRAHIGKINPQVANFMNNEGFEQTDETMAGKGKRVFPKGGHKNHYNAYKKKAENPLEADDKEEADKINNEQSFASIKNFEGLSKQDKESVFQYTMGNFQDINATLRGLSLNGPEKKNKAGLNFGRFTKGKIGYTQNTVSALNKLPPYTEDVYRHDNLFGGFEEVYREGAVVSDMGFMSTTYLPSSLNPAFGKDIVTIIKSKTGRFIKPISHKPNEDEVLFKPGTQFKITKVIKAELNDNDPKYRGWPLDISSEVQAVLDADPVGREIKFVVIREEV